MKKSRGTRMAGAVRRAAEARGGKGLARNRAGRKIMDM